MRSRTKRLLLRILAGVVLNYVCTLCADAVDVTATVDPSHAVTQTIVSAMGGTITATGADGTVFTLTIPADALLADEEITLTPVLSVAGVPLDGGVAAAVQLSPEGLQLLKPALLSITPPSGTPNVGFSYHGSGQEFFFYPLNLGSSTGFAVVHFSGYGLGSGMATGAVTPLDPEDSFLNAIGQPAPPAPSVAAIDGGSIATLAQQYYTNSVSPQVNAALQPGATVAQMSAAFTRAARFIAIIQIIALDQQDPFVGDISTLQAAMDALQVGLFNELYNNECLAEPSPAPIASMIGVVRYFLMTGRDPAVVLSSAYWNKITKCAPQVKVDFDSELKNTYPLPGNGFGLTTSDSVVNAHALQLNWDSSTIGPGAFWAVNGAPLNYVSFTFQIIDPWCSSLASNTGSVISVKAFPDYNLVEPPSAFRLRLAINPETHETFDAAVIDPLSGSCVVLPPRAEFDAYHLGFALVGGLNLFPIPVNTPTTFMRTGSIEGITATEVNTTVTVTTARPQ